MNYSILLFGFFLLISTGCVNDNRVSARFTITRVIKNSTDHRIQLRHYFEINHLDTLLHSGDSVAFSANCVVTGGELGCFNPEYSYALAQALEDSVYIIFNKERILKYRRIDFNGCFGKDVLQAEVPCGYTVRGEGTSIETYTYEITNEDYEMAEPYDGGD
ncbi:hypothetical protein [Ekhidna sp. To15]|uniref:hypothetical protein n=1 Tax=Ekhidna sp. To15 TaxID=3395267 RepID=UPI003F5227CD